MADILTPQQKTALKLIANTELAQHFYFSGGTALAHYYLQHRKSEDLDFFNFNEFDPQSVTVILKSLQNDIGFQKMDFQHSFNRNLFFLHFETDYILKLEFTYYPFAQVEPLIKKEGLLVDSVVDIATNKLFTISQKPRGRDYFDLYSIIQKYGFSVEQLRMFAKQKFDWHVDPLQLASRLNEVDLHLDDPIIFKDTNLKNIRAFFQTEALALSDQILSK